MSSLEPLRYLKNNVPSIENVMIYVSDALRWDYLMSSVAKRGMTFKTVASSTFTASSFASIITGLYPHHHGVFSFSHLLPSGVKHLLNLPGYSSSLWTAKMWTRFSPNSSPLHRCFRYSSAIPLEELPTPFIYLEDERGGHCPYGWNVNDNYAEDDCQTFYKQYSRKSNTDLRERYRQGIARSVSEFEKRMKVIEERDLTGNTLIVYLSDHGERLGEYGGMVGHADPMVPECIYVPCVLIHPELPSGRDLTQAGIIRHVDLFPTVLDMLNMPIPNGLDGVSLLEDDHLPKQGFSYYERGDSRKFWKFDINLKIVEKGVWTGNGGYLYRERPASLLGRFLLAFHRTVLQRQCVQSIILRGIFKRNPLKAFVCWCQMLGTYIKSSGRFGDPLLDPQHAKKLLREMRVLVIQSETERYRRRIKLITV